jgi:hypothetical protein
MMHSGFGRSTSDLVNSWHTIHKVYIKINHKNMCEVPFKDLRGKKEENLWKERLIPG